MAVQLQEERIARQTNPDERHTRTRAVLSVPAVEPRSRWTDRMAFWFWLAGALLMATMILLDVFKGLLR
jgi:hypothetical protein